MLSTRQIALIVAGVVVAMAGSPASRAQDYEPAGEAEIADLDSVRVPAAQYVGNQVCRQCHASAYDAWLGTKHMRAYVFLNTDTGRRIAEKMEVSAEEPARSAKCLACHATAADVEARFRASGFHIEEGVKCEHCHGPGGEHIKQEFFLRRQVVLNTRMKNPSEEDCLVCHKEKPSHDMLDTGPFDFTKASKRIAHPESRDERMEILSQRTWAVLNIGFRTILSYIYW